MLGRQGATAAGEPVPERRAPCFFDPRHGPSVTDVEWAPAGGRPRAVPACAATRCALQRRARTRGRGGSASDGREVPYWEAGPAYGPFAGGFFAGGLVPGLFLGSMLGGGIDVFGPAGARGDFGDERRLRRRRTSAAAATSAAGTSAAAAGTSDARRGHFSAPTWSARKSQHRRVRLARALELRHVAAVELDVARATAAPARRAS